MLTHPTRTSNVPDLPRYAPGEPVLVIGRNRDFIGVVEAYEPQYEYPYWVWLYAAGRWHGFWYSADQLQPFDASGATQQEIAALEKRIAVMRRQMEKLEASGDEQDFRQTERSVSDAAHG